MSLFTLHVLSHVHFSQSVVPAVQDLPTALRWNIAITLQTFVIFIFVVYFFLLTICQYLSALTVTIRITDQ